MYVYSMMSVFLIILALFGHQTLGVSFYNGAQSQVLWNGMSTSCDAAWNTSISCPENIIQYVTWPLQSVGI